MQNMQNCSASRRLLSLSASVCNTSRRHMFMMAASVVAAASRVCNLLTLSGGGSLGAYEAGVLNKLLHENSSIDYDFILGVSAGSMNAAYLSTYPQGPQGLADGVAALHELWRSVQPTFSQH
jgi:predicted acylesterase/phospholipase RssA